MNWLKKSGINIANTIKHFFCWLKQMHSSFFSFIKKNIFSIVPYLSRRKWHAKLIRKTIKYSFNLFLFFHLESPSLDGTTTYLAKPTAITPLTEGWPPQPSLLNCYKNNRFPNVSVNSLSTSSCTRIFWLVFEYSRATSHTADLE